MEIVIIIIQALLIFFVPYFIMRFHNFFITKWIGTIGSAYLFGILLALVIYLINLIFINNPENHIALNLDLGQIGSHLAISIAIPLLLFSANLMEVKKLSKVVLKSFGSLVLSAVLVSSVVFYIYARNIERGAELSGMAIGLYTGGTPNLNAIGNFFGLNSDGGTLLLSANFSDMIIGAFFYVFLLVLCKPLLSKFLRSRDHDIYVTGTSNIENIEELDLKGFKISKKLINRILLAFGLTVLGAVIGYIIFILRDSSTAKLNDLLVPSMMITVTVFGIVFSFNKKIRETEGMNVVGQYGILVFSFALASSLDMELLSGSMRETLILYGTITLGVFIVHTIFSKILDVDVDCAMVTLTAGLYGPAFVPAITKQIKNDDLTVPGLITGSVGYAIGTFLGIALVYLYLL